MRIGIIGPTGAGKSLLSQKLADHYHYTLIEEPVAKSPFLPIFYHQKQQMCFIAQNAFYSDLFLLFYKERENPDVICDSTMLSNLVFCEIMRLEGMMSARQAALTYAIADNDMRHLPELDLTVVVERTNAQLFANVYKRGRDIEQGQEEYLGFHNANYYPALRRIFHHYHIGDEKVLWLPIRDMEDPEEFASILHQIEDRVQTNRKAGK